MIIPTIPSGIVTGRVLFGAPVIGGRDETLGWTGLLPSYALSVGRNIKRAKSTLNYKLFTKGNHNFVCCDVHGLGHKSHEGAVHGLPSGW